MRPHFRLRAGTAAAGLVGGITLKHCTSSPCAPSAHMLPSVIDPTRLSALAALTSPSADQLPFKLGYPPSTVSISRPCGVVVSAQASASERKIQDIEQVPG
jgi:hypothetical protein